MLSKKVTLKNNLLYLFVLVAIGVGFYLHFQFNFIAGDDFRYACTWDGGRVRNLLDVFEREAHEYMNWGGRFVIHSFVSAFAGLWGIELYRICSSVLFVFLMAALVQLCTHKRDIYMLPVLLLFMIFGNVTFKSFYGNIAFSANYLWSSAFVLIYVFLLDSPKAANEKAYIVLLYALYGAFAGALQESYSVGCSVASFCLLWMKRHELGNKKIGLIVGFCIGAAFLILAPGNFKRQSGVGGEESWVMNHVVYGSRMIFDCYILIPLVCVLSYSFHKNRTRTVAFCKKNIFMLIAIIVNVCFAIIVFYAGRRQMLCQIFFSIILLWRWMQEFHPAILPKVMKPLAWGSFVVLLIAYVPVYQYRKEVHNAYIDMIRNTDVVNGVIISKSFDNVSYMSKNLLRDAFTYTEMDDRLQPMAYSRYLTNSSNTSLIKLRLPDTKKQIINICVNANEKNTGVFHEDGTYYYVLKGDSFRNDTRAIVERNATKAEMFIHSLRRQVNPRETVDEVLICTLPHFEENGVDYYIYMFREEIGVKRIEIKI